MRNWFTDLDLLLRGETTRPESLRDGRFEIAAVGLAAVIVLLGAICGLCMGSYSLLKEVPATLNDPAPPYMQMIASAIKVPALFYLTLFVTFPSLYVFNTLVDSRLTLSSVMRLLIASLAVNLAVLASLGPIVLFFSLTTKSYAFIQLLNVSVFSVAGVIGLGFLLQTLHRLTTVVHVVKFLSRRPHGEWGDVRRGQLYRTVVGAGVLSTSHTAKCKAPLVAMELAVGLFAGSDPNGVAVATVRWIPVA
jgi:hypothetical protein